MKVDVWSDIACPWCYIGKRRFEGALAQFPHRESVEVTWHSYQLDPSLPEHYDGTELDYLETRKGMPRERVQQMFDHVTEVAAGEGLAYDFGSVVVANSQRGHELIHFAAGRGRQDEAKEALLSAHFEHGEDIGEVETLVRVGESIGLQGDEIRSALDAGTYTQAVRDDIADARRYGISGVPFFVIDEKYGVSGAQPSEVFGQVLDQAWRESNPLTMVGSPSAQGGDDVACGPDGCAI
ncbi:DsbA family oxidoreductase [Knoellia subterranea]|uniref:DSBA oxidoreductase n=1 Tax=Knoellia subterranea KCTC 19937 TaxID=1385521 RepID=A0A0A0JV01_9MICO|nr:DsbA family oxidoreductase [Knoellia subterranea]KGN39471.1 DSBA oxidoreductase [Knoellia subterranea KCTC 19937]